MNRSKLSLRVARLSFAAMCCVALTAPIAVAQGQAGAMRDAIAVYEQLLRDPDLDPATRAEVRRMIQMLEQQEAYMQSATPGYGGFNSGSEYDSVYESPYADDSNTYGEQDDEEGARCAYSSGCVMGAQ